MPSTGSGHRRATVIRNAEQVRSFLPQLDEIVEEGLVMIDDVEVVKYVGRRHESASASHPGQPQSP